MRFTFTWFHHARDARHGVRIIMGEEELAAQIADPPAHHGLKQDLPLLCPATFTGEHRGNERVEQVHMLGLDIDEPQLDPAGYVMRLAAELGGVETFAYSTASSSPGGYKLRALIPYNEPATGEQHRASWEFVRRLLEREGFKIDNACSDPARGFYVWAIPRNGVYFHAHVLGVPWPVAAAAEAEMEHRAREVERWEAEAAQRAAKAPRWGKVRAPLLQRARNYVAKMAPAIAGQDGHGAAFAVARKLIADFRLDDDNAMALFKEYNARCQPPWSERELRHKIESAKKARVHVVMDERDSAR